MVEREIEITLGDGTVETVRERKLPRRRRTAADTINDLASQCAAAAAHWYVDEITGEPKPENIPLDLLLIISEAVEGFEAIRKGGIKDDKLTDRSMLEAELGDIAIRVFGLAARQGFDLGNTILEKMAFNKTRADHWVSTRLSPGGKKF
jgi:NTP pyrophosphatase (non-canonical NTP hydrolase)